jgi:cytochrome c553
MKSRRLTASCFRRHSGVFVATVATALCGLFFSEIAQNQTAVPQPPPYWAYVVNPPEPSGASAKPPDHNPVHVPDSTATFTVAQTQDFFAPPDWHPVDHSAMPKIVAAGRAQEVFACGYCHLPNGQGRPENASLAGLPAAYIAQQMADFKSGLRKSSEPKHGPTTAMIGVAAKANDDEIQAAAKYFSALKPRPWIRVVETDTVPKTHITGWMLVVTDSAPNSSAKMKMEPIGQRIIETPENLERTELRDDHSGFIAYVPKGSLKRGEALVKTGGAGKTVPCSACHGPDLKGLDKTPPLAGRSPSYIVRQLYDIKDGTRHGVATQVMTSTVTKLTISDMIAIAAYTASLKP